MTMPDPPNRPTSRLHRWSLMSLLFAFVIFGVAIQFAASFVGPQGCPADALACWATGQRAAIFSLCLLPVSFSWLFIPPLRRLMQATAVAPVAALVAIAVVSITVVWRDAIQVVAITRQGIVQSDAGRTRTSGWSTVQTITAACETHNQMMLTFSVADGRLLRVPYGQWAWAVKRAPAIRDGLAKVPRRLINVRRCDNAYWGMPLFQADFATPAR